MVRLQGRNGNVVTKVDKGAHEAFMRPFVEIEATHRAFVAAEKVLENTIGVPICMPNCGKCCQMLSPVVWESEAKFIVSWLLGQDTEYRERVLSACEGWLLDRDPRVPTYGYSGILTQEQQDKLRPEVDFLTGAAPTALTGGKSDALPCPFLASDKGCTVHEARPLACRAYGVTHVPAPACPRPLSKMESLDSRAHISENSTLGQQLVKMVGATVEHSHIAGMLGSMFLPTAIYMTMRPEKYSQILHLIATAKTTVMNQSPNVLFQSQVDRVWQQMQNQPGNNPR